MLYVGGAAGSFEDVPPRTPAVRPAVGDELPPPLYVPKELEGLGGIADNSDVGIKWNGSIKGQGENWEVYNEKVNPDAARLLLNAKTFDQFNGVTQEAISNKTLNTLSVSYIRESSENLRADETLH